MKKIVTNTMMFNKFKKDVLPRVTGDKWCNARLTTKMDLFRQYVRYLEQNGLINEAQVAKAETKFVDKFITPYVQTNTNKVLNDLNFRA